MASRKGSFLERDVARTFNLAGLSPKLNAVRKGYEIDLWLDIDGYKVIIECKAYEKGGLHLINLIHQWESKNKEIKADKILFVIIGKDISARERALAQKHNITIWDENKFERTKDKVVDEKEKSREYLLEQIDERIPVVARKLKGKSETLQMVIDDLARKRKGEIIKSKISEREIILTKQQEKIKEELERLAHNLDNAQISIRESGTDYSLVIFLKNGAYFITSRGLGWDFWGKEYALDIEFENGEFKLNNRLKEYIKILESLGFKKFVESDLDEESYINLLSCDIKEGQMLFSHGKLLEKKGLLKNKYKEKSIFLANFDKDLKLTSKFIDLVFRNFYKAKENYRFLIKYEDLARWF